MELHTLTCYLLYVLVATAHLPVGCSLASPGSQIELLASCLSPGSSDGQPQDGKSCTLGSFDNYELPQNLGVLPNGSCVTCGTEVQGGKCSAVAYRTRKQRHCACNIGFYGDQTARTCKACPAGSTTQGYGATKLKDCNVCAAGYEGTAPHKCVACSQLFRGPVTTKGPGNKQQCVCPKGYTGEPGSCKKCLGLATTAYPGAQKCVCPGGGKAPFCRPCMSFGAELDGKCVCAVGYTGKWPNCKFCRASSDGYSTTTTKPGSQKCVCDEMWNRGVTAGSDGTCTCDTDLGFYRKVVPGRCSRLEAAGAGAKVIKVDGHKRLGCDVSKGYGAALTEQVEEDNPDGGAGTSLCIKCNTLPNTVLDPKTSRCLCKAGFFVNTAYMHSNRFVDGGNRTAPGGTVRPPPSSQPGRQQYCIKCTAPYLKAARAIPGDDRSDNLCRCNWEAGYVGHLQLGQLCGQCPSDRPIAGGTNMLGESICVCPKGKRAVDADRPGPDSAFFCGAVKKYPCRPGEEVTADMLGNPRCSCPSGELNINETACLRKHEVVPYRSANAKVTISYWANVTAATLPVWGSLGDQTATTLETTLKRLNSTANLLALPGAPKARKNVAVVVSVYLCLGRENAMVAEVKVVGRAWLMKVGWRPGDEAAVLKVDGSGSKEQAGYVDLECAAHDLHFVSGQRADAKLSMRVVPFER